MESLNYLIKVLAGISQSPLEKVQIEEQNKEYEGVTFSIGKQTFRSRKAKRTPKKAGYFVVFWEKDDQNKNQPYDGRTAPDKLVITVFDQEKKGQFIFPKELLIKKGILSHEKVVGKMALRVYPTWLDELNRTASATQRWQAPFFIDLTAKPDVEKLKKLYFDQANEEVK
ncbi:MepB family protein [Enterococcus crotali]|uniref:MepB family protein n=1 Tax=Enterococcus crotali TaxID=1453587 RepID=UPI000471CC96|nr:MepB family protein [Enterococcus crotali]